MATTTTATTSSLFATPKRVSTLALVVMVGLFFTVASATTSSGNPAYITTVDTSNVTWSVAPNNKCEVFFRTHFATEGGGGSVGGEEKQKRSAKNPPTVTVRGYVTSYLLIESPYYWLEPLNTNATYSEVVAGGVGREHTSNVSFIVEKKETGTNYSVVISMFDNKIPMSSLYYMTLTVRPSCEATLQQVIRPPSDARYNTHGAVIFFMVTVFLVVGGVLAIVLTEKKPSLPLSKQYDV